MVPPVTANAFAVINSSRSTIRGKPAESPARIKRFIPKATKTNSVKTIPVECALRSMAIIIKSTARKIFAIATIFLRLKRSKKIPAYGPISE